MATAQVTAVHEDDAIEFLERLGLAEDFRDGHLSCVICDNALRDNGLGAGRRSAEGFEFSCARLDCLEAFHRAE